MYNKIEGYSNLLRDSNSNAIINTDFNKYQKYVMMKNKKKDEIQVLKNEILDLKSDINEIKNLLKELIHESR